MEIEEITATDAGAVRGQDFCAFCQFNCRQFRGPRSKL